eukprot:jgi/Chrzof1/9609/Cz04g09170.t1
MAVTDALNAIVSYLDVLSQNRVHQFASFAAFSLCGALFFACISCIIETATHHAYLFLERQGLIRRLVPETPNTVTHYKLATFKTFVGSLFPVILVLCYVYKPLLAAAKPDWNPLRFMPFVYLQVIIHDAWFWAVHHVMHRVKYLYRKIHVQHHVLEGDLNVFGTADMHLVEAFFLTMSYYALYLTVGTAMGSWNPVMFYVWVILEGNMNMGGHCGYLLPNWLQFLVTMGVGNTPWSACSTTHYIHHLDPRVNRALYFTWCDKLVGTYRAHHPKIKELSPEEWRKYNSRPIKYLKKQLGLLMT